MVIKAARKPNPDCCNAYRGDAIAAKHGRPALPRLDRRPRRAGAPPAIDNANPGEVRARSGRVQAIVSVTGGRPAIWPTATPLPATWTRPT